MVSSIQKEQYETICMLEKAEKTAKKELLVFRQKYSSIVDNRNCDKSMSDKHCDLTKYFSTAYDQFREYKKKLEHKYKFKFPIECETAGDDKLYHAGYFKNKIINKKSVIVC